MCPLDNRRGVNMFRGFNTSTTREARCAFHDYDSGNTGSCQFLWEVN